MVQHRLLPESINFKEETLAEAMTRYAGFGKDLFLALESCFPGMLTKSRFFQPQVYQEEDIWACYEDGTTQFGIQLDPACEVIVLWDESGENQIEIGTWWPDENKAATDFIEEFFFKGKSSGRFLF